ncbi:MAG: hypothetical protein KDC98_24555 [Planctomycetes bacterium]|nr:hypothetical protein [Planctomycetota bacterium]
MSFPARLLFPLLMAATVAAQGKNLLFYGNSYTYYSWGYGVPELVQLIAAEAGHPTPTIVTGPRRRLGSAVPRHRSGPGRPDRQLVAARPELGPRRHPGPRTRSD